MGLPTATRSPSQPYPTPCISNRICPVHKGTVPKSQPNETQRILTQLVRIHQTCKADALKIFHFFFRLRSKPGCPFHHLPHSKAAHSAICWLGGKKKKKKKNNGGLVSADIDPECDWYRRWRDSRLGPLSVDLRVNTGLLLSSPNQINFGFQLLKRSSANRAVSLGMQTLNLPCRLTYLETILRV